MNAIDVPAVVAIWTLAAATADLAPAATSKMCSLGSHNFSSTKWHKNPQQSTFSQSKTNATSLGQKNL